MKKIVLLICVLLLSQITKGQELSLPAGSQYLADSEFLIAPTFAGIGNNVRIRASGVAQWVGIKNAPAYQTLSTDMRLGDRSGIGVMFYNDRNGHTKQFGSKMTFSHHLTLSLHDNFFLSFGVSYLINSFKIDINRFSDNGKPVTDWAVTNNRSMLNHNFEVGALLRYKGAFLSLAATNILNKKTDGFTSGLSFESGGYELSAKSFEPAVIRAFNLFAGYRYKTRPSSPLEIEPSLFSQYFQADGRSFTDLNLKVRWFDFEDYYWVGGTYRFLNDQILNPLSVGPMGGLKKGFFYFAYSYQLMLNEIKSYNTGTHMVTIGIDLFQGIGGCNCTER